VGHWGDDLEQIGKPSSDTDGRPVPLWLEFEAVAPSPYHLQGHIYHIVKGIEYSSPFPLAGVSAHENFDEIIEGEIFFRESLFSGGLVWCEVLIFGGGVGNRTRVRKQPTIDLYVRSSADQFRLATARRPKLVASLALGVDLGSGSPRSKPSR